MLWRDLLDAISHQKRTYLIHGIILGFKTVKIKSRTEPAVMTQNAFVMTSAAWITRSVLRACLGLQLRSWSPTDRSLFRFGRGSSPFTGVRAPVGWFISHRQSRICRRISSRLIHRHLLGLNMGRFAIAVCALLACVALAAGASVNTPSKLTIAPGEARKGSRGSMASRKLLADLTQLRDYGEVGFLRSLRKADGHTCLSRFSLWSAGACSGIEIDNLNAKFGYQIQLDELSDPSCANAIRFKPWHGALREKVSNGSQNHWALIAQDCLSIVQLTERELFPCRLSKFYVQVSLWRMICHIPIDQLIESYGLQVWSRCSSTTQSSRHLQLSKRLCNFWSDPAGCLCEGSQQPNQSW